MGNREVTAGSSQRLSVLLVRARVLVIVGWAVAAVAAIQLLPPIESAEGGGLKGLVPQKSEAVEAEIASFELFGFPLLSRTLVVQRDPDGLSPEAQARFFVRAINLNRGLYEDLRHVGGALPIANTLRLFPASSERGTTAITYLFFRPEVKLSTRERQARAFAERHVNQPTDAFVGITGAVPGRIAEGRVIKAHLSTVERATLLLIALIVGVHFRAFGAPLITLAAAGVSFVIATRVVAWMAAATGIALPGELEPVLVVLLLGIVTDYSIFYLDAAKERLARGEPSTTAAERASAGIGAIVLAAGLTVAAGTFALYVATLEVFKALGPGLALTVLVSLAVSVTFVPACIAVFGRGLFWPAGPGGHEESPAAARAVDVRERVTYRAVRRPVALVIAAVVTGLLLVPASFVLDTRLGFSIVSGLPEDAGPRQAAFAAARGFAPGILSPVVVVFEGPELARSRRSLIRLERLIERNRGVVGVVGLEEAGALSRVFRRIPRLERLVGERPDPARLALRAVLAGGRDAVRFMLIFRDPPLGARAIRTLQELRLEMPEMLRRSGVQPVSVGFAGDTALAEETIAQTLDDLKRIVATVLLLDIILLVVFLRSALAPLYVMAVSVLGFAASLGVTTLLFQGILGEGSLSFFVPFAGAVLLVSLGSDYSVFLIGRIWNEASRVPLRRAIATATPRASRAIAVAGITLAFSFATLALVPLDAFRQFAFLMAAGILIDTFVVRSFLMPAVIAVFGGAGSWPRRFRARPALGARFPPGSAQDRKLVAGTGQEPAA